MNKGFTLIELMTSVAVFGFITAIVAGLFIYSVIIQRSVLAQQKLLDEASYVLEYMSRGLRLAERNDTGLDDCGPADPVLNGTSYRLTHETFPGSGVWQGIKFRNPDPEVTGNVFCREFFLDTSAGRLKESQGSVEDFITSSQMDVVSFRVLVAGDTRGDDLQPRVTILLELKGKGTKPEAQPAIHLQTTVSQRNLDI